MLVMHGEDDQIVPYVAAGPLSAKLLKNGTLKTYKGLPHGMITTQAEDDQRRPPGVLQGVSGPEPGFDPTLSIDDTIRPASTGRTDRLTEPQSEENYDMRLQSRRAAFALIAVLLSSVPMPLPGIASRQPAPRGKGSDTGHPLSNGQGRGVDISTAKPAQPARRSCFSCTGSRPRPHVPQPDPGAGGPLPCHSAGLSRASARACARSQDFAYTFGHYADIVDGLLTQVGVKRYAIYLMDYGAPVGYRLALKHPDRVTALIVQNGNAPRKVSRRSRIRSRPIGPTVRGASRGNRRPRRAGDDEVPVHGGVADVSRIDPDNSGHDQSLLDRPGTRTSSWTFPRLRNHVPLYPNFRSSFVSASRRR